MIQCRSTIIKLMSFIYCKIDFILFDFILCDRLKIKI